MITIFEILLCAAVVLLVVSRIYVSCTKKRLHRMHEEYEESKKEQEDG